MADKPVEKPSKEPARNEGPKEKPQAKQEEKPKLTREKQEVVNNVKQTIDKDLDKNRTTRQEFAMKDAANELGKAAEQKKSPKNSNTAAPAQGEQKSIEPTLQEQLAATREEAAQQLRNQGIPEANIQRFLNAQENYIIGMDEQNKSTEKRLNIQKKIEEARKKAYQKDQQQRMQQAETAHPGYTERLADARARMAAKTESSQEATQQTSGSDKAERPTAKKTGETSASQPNVEVSSTGVSGENKPSPVVTEELRIQYMRNRVEQRKIEWLQQNPGKTTDSDEWKTERRRTLAESQKLFNSDTVRYSQDALANIRPEAPTQIQEFANQFGHATPLLIDSSGAIVPYEFKPLAKKVEKVISINIPGATAGYLEDKQTGRRLMGSEQMRPERLLAGLNQEAVMKVLTADQPKLLETLAEETKGEKVNFLLLLLLMVISTLKEMIARAMKENNMIGDKKDLGFFDNLMYYGLAAAAGGAGTEQAGTTSQQEATQTTAAVKKVETSGTSKKPDAAPPVKSAAPRLETQQPETKQKALPDFGPQTKAPEQLPDSKPKLLTVSDENTIKPTVEIKTPDYVEHQ